MTFEEIDIINDNIDLINSKIISKVHRKRYELIGAANMFHAIKDILTLEQQEKLTKIFLDMKIEANKFYDNCLNNIKNNTETIM